MPTIDLVVASPASTSVRARQVSAMFDVPQVTESRVEWRGEFPYDAEPWSVGLIVGPSGSGKSTIASHVFGRMPDLEWKSASVIDDIAAGQSVEAVSGALSSVGFNTIPAWLRPFHVLSNGEKFRADVARRMLELPDPIMVDEFTSVVDRQVAQVGSHAVQKFVRKAGRKFVAVTCHYDVIDWLQPDWVLDASTMVFTRRLLQRRPAIECEIKRVPYDVWRIFAPYHYLTADLHRAARCFALHVGGRPVAFAGALHKPHPKANNIKGLSRLVTLPDWQGMGLAMALSDAIGAAYKATGYRWRSYPAHPALIRAFDRSRNWRLEKRPGTHSPGDGKTSRFNGKDGGNASKSRPCAVFEYCGPAMSNVDEARRLLG